MIPGLVSDHSHVGLVDGVSVSAADYIEGVWQDGIHVAGPLPAAAGAAGAP